MTTTLIIGLLISAMEMGVDIGKYVKDHFGMTPLEFRRVLFHLMSRNSAVAPS